MFGWSTMLWLVAPVGCDLSVEEPDDTGGGGQSDTDTSDTSDTSDTDTSDTSDTSDTGTVDSGDTGDSGDSSDTGVTAPQRVALEGRTFTSFSGQDVVAVLVEVGTNAVVASAEDTLDSSGDFLLDFGAVGELGSTYRVVFYIDSGNDVCEDNTADVFLIVEMGEVIGETVVQHTYQTGEELPAGCDLMVSQVDLDVAGTGYDSWAGQEAVVNLYSLGPTFPIDPVTVTISSTGTFSAVFPHAVPPVGAFYVSVFVDVDSNGTCDDGTDFIQLTTDTFVDGTGQLAVSGAAANTTLCGDVYP